jgi:hypothetical protein
VDETGFFDFVDVRIEKVIVPDTHFSESISILADRNFKRATLVGALRLMAQH